MRDLDIDSEELTARLLAISKSEPVCILDSCGVSHLGSHLLIAGVGPSQIIEVSNDDAAQTLSLLNRHLSRDVAAVFTVSHEFGSKLEGITKRQKETKTPAEPDVFLAAFDCLIVHDYDSGKTFITGDPSSSARIGKRLRDARSHPRSQSLRAEAVRSNFTRLEYLNAIEEIKELIRKGDTYQTNLTQRFEVELNDRQTPQDIFADLRRNHPAPFAVFIQREGSTVISASPERFFFIEGNIIRTSPIKGTRPRGRSHEEDESLRRELLASEKDIAENTMIVDLLRNDIGKVCEYGSVEVEKLCDLEEHPTLLHLVSTVRGKLRNDAEFSDILKALFPCGSITGAPKHRTMQIIDRIETADRGLSMGAIGVYVPLFHVSGKNKWNALKQFCSFEIQLSVAIRTMVVHDNIASFNVGGGIVIDSDPAKEYEESLLKAKALLNALHAEFDSGSEALGTHS